MTSNVWIAGTPFPCDGNVVRWDEGPKYDAHQTTCMTSISDNAACVEGCILPFSEKIPDTQRAARRYSFRRRVGRKPTLRAAQGAIRQFVIHHDGLIDSKTTFHVLQNERGLSCHFLIDNDGTIYQTLDMAFQAWHAEANNPFSVGVELANRGRWDLRGEENYYEANGRGPRDKTTCVISGHKYECWDYTPEQKRAMIDLARAMRAALPNVPVDYPQKSPGELLLRTMRSPYRYRGYLGHYHCSTAKWDPGPYDFKALYKALQKSVCYPTGAASSRNLCFDESADDAARKQLDQLYANNEGREEGGFFPLGPFGKSRLWHGGLHLAGEPGDPVFAPLSGTVVAARMGASDTGQGSANFVLMRHDMTVGAHTFQFFSLYFHLADELGRADKQRPKWAKKLDMKAGEVVPLLIAVESGDQIGRVGVAGPPDLRQAQLHLEIFSREELTHTLNELGDGYGWARVVGTSGGRFCIDRDTIDLVDKGPKDTKLTPSDFAFVFSRPAEAKLMRNFAVLHTSEWIATPDWYDSLRAAADFEDVDDTQLRNLVEDQITPTLWWSRDIAEHAGLPRDGVVWHYHPLTFIYQAYVAVSNAAQEDQAIDTSNLEKGTLMDDNDDIEGKHAFDPEIEEADDDSDKWPVDRLIRGFDALDE